MESISRFYEQGFAAGAKAARHEAPDIPATAQELLERAAQVVQVLPGPLSAREEHEYYIGWIDGYVLACSGAKPVMMHRGRTPRPWNRSAR